MSNLPRGLNTFYFTNTPIWVSTVYSVDSHRHIITHASQPNNMAVVFLHRTLNCFICFYHKHVATILVTELDFSPSLIEVWG